MNTTKYLLKINQPCEEEWRSMDLTSRGRFCLRCSKEVIDFTSLSDKEVLEVIAKSSGKICGRLNIKQLNKPFKNLKNEHKFPYRQIAAGIMLIGVAQSSFAFNRSSSSSVYTHSQNAQFSKCKISTTGATKKDTSVCVIKGKIIDADDKTPLPGVLIIIKETSIKVYTNVNGEFEITLPDTPEVQKLNFKASYIGYSDKEFSTDRQSLNPVIELYLNQAILGEVVVVKKKKWWQFWK